MAGGPGTGKSRFADTLGGLMQRSSRGTFTHVAEVKLTFGNGYRLNDFEMGYAPQMVLACRALYFAFREFRCELGSLPPFLLHHLDSGLTLGHVLQVVVELYAEHHHLPEGACVGIAFVLDEAHAIPSERPE